MNEKSVQLSGGFKQWPLRVLVDEHGKELPLKVLGAPPREKKEFELLRDYLGSGRKLLGLSAYQNFPGRILFPQTEEAEWTFDVWEALGDIICGWLYCMKRPDLYLPSELPRIRLANSDFSSHHRVTPQAVDKRPMSTRKKYDVLYVCRDGRWNKYCRNWTLGVKCVREMTRLGYQVCMVGAEPPADLVESPRVTTHPTLKWYEFLQVVANARCLLVPNIYDASPRILTDALCLNVPILVNRHIFGGWHYVTPISGAFFSNEVDVIPQLQEVLESKLEPREFFAAHFGPRPSGRLLADFVQRIL